MDAEEVLLNLFDSNWFGHKISTENTCPKPQESTNPSHDQVLQLDHDHDHKKHAISVPQKLKVRSLSEQLLDSKINGSFFSSENSVSPSSVLATPKLRTIFSGKEVKGDLPDVDDHDQGKTKEEEVIVPVKKKKESSERRRGRRKRPSYKLGGLSSKSLSELEFEELKGFMDLGFVFTEEECRDTKLVSMIPGLQRYCKKCTGTDHQRSEADHDHHHEVHDEFHDQRGNSSQKGAISRPYLSEAWDVLEDYYFDHQQRKKKETFKPLVIDWKVSATLGNEISIKDQLKFWAHTVASTVR